MKAKRVWTARLLALFVMSLGYSFIIYSLPANKLLWKEKIEILADGNVEEIEAAVKQLGRADIRTTITDAPWFVRRPLVLWWTAGFFTSFGVILGIYYVIYCIISGILNRKKRDDNLLKPTS